MTSNLSNLTQNNSGYAYTFSADELIENWTLIKSFLTKGNEKHISKKQYDIIVNNIMAWIIKNPRHVLNDLQSRNLVSIIQDLPGAQLPEIMSCLAENKLLLSELIRCASFRHISNQFLIQDMDVIASWDTDKVMFDTSVSLKFISSCFFEQVETQVMKDEELMYFEIRNLLSFLKDLPNDLCLALWDKMVFHNIKCVEKLTRHIESYIISTRNAQTLTS